MQLIHVIVAAIVLWNIVVFAMYAIDKSKARNKKMRIKEATLIACAFLMGGFGAMLGMSVLRHKTQKPKFKILVPIAVVVNIAVIVAVLFLTGVIEIHL
ncbi:MAG: DUF1294 domain-containing protein [Defluviitaleaceae bacterium]|nr:DUF1294 domain-containing protein [Defluviitaleaceae bacterium]